MLGGEDVSFDNGNLGLVIVFKWWREVEDGGWKNIWKNIVVEVGRNYNDIENGFR